MLICDICLKMGGGEIKAEFKVKELDLCAEHKRQYDEALNLLHNLWVVNPCNVDTFVKAASRLMPEK